MGLVPVRTSLSAKPHPNPHPDPNPNPNPNPNQNPTPNPKPNQVTASIPSGPGIETAGDGIEDDGAPVTACSEP